MKSDSSDRQVMILHEVRAGLVSSAASVTTGTATVLLGGDTDYFMDIVELTATNNSTVAAQVSLVSDGTTVRTFIVPQGNTIQLGFDAPILQPLKNLPWIIDMEDITGTTVTINATHIKNRN